MTNNTSIVMGSLGYFFILALLLGMAGFGTFTVQTPSDVATTSGTTNQSFSGAVLECVLTLFGDCSRTTVTRTYAVITNVLTFASQAFIFLFQLLTLQVPNIPGWLNALIVMPPAIGLGFIALQTIRGTS